MAKLVKVKIKGTQTYRLVQAPSKPSKPSKPKKR